MLNRRFLRIKVMQAAYAYLQEGPENINAGEKQLIVSLDKLYELYIHLLSLIVEISDFASIRIEENKLKQLPTPEDLNPNLRFVQNHLIHQLENNRDYKRRYASYKINWVDETEMLRKLYNILREDERFVAYMNKPVVSYADEKRIVGKVMLEIFSTSEHLHGFFEERSIYWTEDFDIAIMMVDKTITGYKEKSDEYTPLPTLLKHENESDGGEYMQFVKQLYRKTLINNAELSRVINERAPNWEIDRIALLDTVLLKMAITELTEFPSIPVKVTLNEYIELSKEYSSAKSKLFINGILDKLINEYSEKGLIRKIGRGLIE